jgi:hypothetical protein
MREAPLTDREKTDKGLYDFHDPRVRGREVTAQWKDQSRRRRGGGAAMNSTATELEFTRRRGMRAIVKVFVVWTLGLAVLVGSPAVSLALPKLRVGKTYCVCGCYSQQANVNTNLMWEMTKACGLSDHKGCSTTDSNGKKVSGTLHDCWQCTADTDSGCSASGALGVHRLIGETELTVEPEPSPVPPGEQRHQVAPKLNQ